jgi:hypothetical protein
VPQYRVSIVGQGSSADLRSSRILAAAGHEVGPGPEELARFCNTLSASLPDVIVLDLSADGGPLTDHHCAPRPVPSEAGERIDERTASAGDQNSLSGFWLETVQSLAAQAPLVVIGREGVDRGVIEGVTGAGAFGFIVPPYGDIQLAAAVEIAAARGRELALLKREVDLAAARLAARKLVDRAKALLMARQQISEEEAFRQIQRQSMATRKSMGEIARLLILTFSP